MTYDNNSIAKAIGLQSSMVYKMRKGERLPGFNTMLRLEQLLDWKINEQTDARRKGLYYEALNKVILSKSRIVTGNL